MDKEQNSIVVRGGSVGELVESWVFLTSERDFSIYSERLILRIIQVAQSQIAGADFKDGTSIGQIEYSRLGEAMLEIPISGLLSGGDDSNYAAAKKAVMELMHSPYFVERPKLDRSGGIVLNKDGSQAFEFVGHQILNDCQVNVKPGYVVVTVNPVTWAGILDFSKGFRKYDLEAALRLRSKISLRLFKLLSNQSEPITFSLEHLRKMWHLDERYKVDTGTHKAGDYVRYPNNGDFIRKVIEPAKKELDGKAPWSFSYVKNSAKGSRAITSVTFFPVRRVQSMSDKQLYRLSTDTFRELGAESFNMLKNKFGFTDKGLDNNIDLWVAVRQSGMDLPAFLSLIAPSALRADNVQGYTVMCIRKHMEEAYGTQFSAR